MTHTLRPALTVVLLALCVCSASGNLFLYDSFNYSPSGTSLGTAGSANWVKNGTSPDPTVQSGGGLTYPGLQVSTDTVSLQYDGSGVNAGSGAPAGTDGHTISTGITTGSIYYSLLMKVTTVTTTGGNGFGAGANLTGGSFMAGLENIAATGAPATNTTAATLLIRSGDGTQGSSTYQLGTSVTTNTADRAWDTGQAFSTGASAETVFVVVKLDLGSSTAQLFINPTPGAAEPTPQITAPNDALFVLGTGIKSFFVRNNSVEPDTLSIDELRIGDAWQDVTPAAGAGISGDFNNDGIVDAADYVVWRKADGTSTGYSTWRTHFGQSTGSGLGVSASASVPEPATAVLLMIAAACWCLRRGRAA